jgi:hypothetical protein
VDFRYTLADLGRIADPELSADRALRVRLLVLKWAGRDGDLRALLRAVLEAAAALGLDDLVATLRYILNEDNEVAAELVREVLAEVTPRQEERVMSIAAEQWKAEGIQIGLSQGKAEGMAEGEAKAMAATLLKQLSRRFGPMPAGIEQRIRSADTRQLDAWLDAVIDAPTLEDVIQSPV